MSYTKATAGEVDSVIDDEHGGMWFLRDALDAESVGVTIMELTPGTRGKEHDHGHDGQEEVYVCVEGTVDVDCGDETVTLAENQALRLSPDQTRQIHNRSDDRAKLVLIGGPEE
jgi:mannose-6-phosphate isomerase-like protein (cupin superfamily)